MNPLKDSESRWIVHFSEKNKISSDGFLVSLKRRIANIFSTINVSVVQKKIQWVQNKVQWLIRFTQTLITLRENFESNFSVKSWSDFSDQAAYVRHEVFCREKWWEKVQESGIEQDQYDAYAFPIVLFQKNTESPIACTRLIQADGWDIPVEQYIGPIKTDREKSAEVSRLAVIGDFRRRKNEQGKVIPEERPDPIQWRFSMVTVGICLALIVSAKENNIEYLYFLVKPSLFKNLEKLGAKPVQIWFPVNHKWIRIPCMIQVSEMIDNLPWWSKPIWNSVNEQLRKNK